MIKITTTFCQKTTFFYDYSMNVYFAQTQEVFAASLNQTMIMLKKFGRIYVLTQNKWFDHDGIKLRRQGI